MIITDPALLAADPAEVSDHLLDAGLTGIRTNRAGGPDFLNVIADQGDAAVAAALAGWVPATGSSAPYAGRMPPDVAVHVPHLKAYYAAQRDGTQALKTQAQRLADLEHVTADVILVVRTWVRSDV